MGAWIEIIGSLQVICRYTSLPSWERGLKSRIVCVYSLSDSVAPLVGAWIEIQLTGFVRVKDIVAPHVGAWIEICRRRQQSNNR